jgi:type II secretory pathway component PulJ
MNQFNLRFQPWIKNTLKFRDERGASLVELLVAIAISVLVFSVLSTALVQFILTTRWGNSQLQVTSDIQVVSLWLGRDALEAASFTPGTGAEYGTLAWADSSQQYRYLYDSAETALVREHYDGGVLQSTTTVARQIQNQADVTFTITGNLLSVSITSTAGGESETASLDLALRTR